MGCVGKTTVVHDAIDDNTVLSWAGDYRREKNLPGYSEEKEQ